MIGRFHFRTAAQARGPAGAEAPLARAATPMVNLLLGLRGRTVNLTLPGAVLVGQKIVSVENGLLYTVDGAGTAAATAIGQIQSVEF